MSLFRLADHVAASLHWLDRPFDTSGLIRAAQKRAGSTDFGTENFCEPLGVLLDSFSCESALSAVGRIGARWDVLRLLGNLLRFQQEERKNPAIRQECLSKPVFITGLPRSGTTFLHTLLAEDPANLVPRCWQTIYPYPIAGEAPTDTALRQGRVERQLRGFALLAPEVHKVHPLAADMPQECSEITAHVFRSLRFDTTHYVPSYAGWLDRTGHVDAYRFHKRFLQHLQHQFGVRQWVLKCPEHVFALDAIMEVYPDARFVFIHRDPLHILASVARLTEILRSPFTRCIDRRSIGRQVTERWIGGASRIVRASGSGEIAPGQVFHVHYAALVADPVGTVAALYRHFGIELTDAVKARIGALVVASPKGGYGHNEYRLEDFGLDASKLEERVRGYTEHFDIDRDPRSRTSRIAVATA